MTGKSIAAEQRENAQSKVDDGLIWSDEVQCEETPAALVSGQSCGPDGFGEEQQGAAAAETDVCGRSAHEINASARPDAVLGSGRMPEIRTLTSGIVSAQVVPYDMEAEPVSDGGARERIDEEPTRAGEATEGSV